MEPRQRSTSQSGEQSPGSDGADRVVLSYPADLSEWGRDIVEGSPFRAYLRKRHDRIAVGDCLEEFVGVGCCGSALDVPLRVESIAGGDLLDAETDIVFEAREACGLDGGWRVQSADGPTL